MNIDNGNTLRAQHLDKNFLIDLNTNTNEALLQQEDIIVNYSSIHEFKKNAAINKNDFECNGQETSNSRNVHNNMDLLEETHQDHEAHHAERPKSSSMLSSVQLASTPFFLPVHLRVLVSGFRSLSTGRLPSIDVIKQLWEMLAVGQRIQLLEEFPCLQKLLGLDNHDIKEKSEREQRKHQDELRRRHQLLNEIVNRPCSSLEEFVYLPNSVRKRCEWELRLLRLRQFQAVIRHQVLSEGLRVQNPLSVAATPFNTFIGGRISTIPPGLSGTQRIACISQPSDAPAPKEDPCQRSRLSASIQRLTTRCRQQILHGDELTRINLKSKVDELPLHYRTIRKHWSRAREILRQNATEACKRVEALIARREIAREREHKQRLKLLRENDFAQYLELVKQSKNARIEELLNQTDRFLDGVSVKVAAQRQATSYAREAQKVSGSRSRKSKAFQCISEEALRSTEGHDQTSENFNQGLYRSVVDQSPAEIVKQPESLIGGTLMPYQIAGLQFLVNLYCSDLSGILADEMGLGKTIQTIALLAYLKELKGVDGPHLVIVPLSTLPNWISEFEKWCPSLSVIQFRGTRPERRELSHSVKRGSFNVCVTTYDWVIREKGTLQVPYWSFIIVDEGHRMKNVRSKFHVTLGEFQSTHRLLLTGTPLQNNLTELWSLLNFLLPKIFTSAIDFEMWFEEPFKNFPGQEAAAELTEEEKFLIINRLHSVLRPFLLRRVKADVLDDLPEKREYIIRIQLSAWQKLGYEQISKKALKIHTAEGRVSLRSFANVMMQLRKIVNHPYLFENEYFVNENIYRVSGKFEVLDRMLPKMVHFKHKTLIFCQMTQLMDILDDYLEFKGYKRCRLDGSTALEDRRERMAQFNDPASDTYIFTLSTRAGGLGLNLQAADTVVIFDSDWNPHQDLQAQARAHRLGQKNEVRVFRLVTVSGVEEAVLSKAQQKLDIDEKIIQAGMFNNRCTEEERQQKLRMLLYSKDMEKETRVTTPQELNRFMARTEEEEEYFQSYDEALFGAEAFKIFEENCCATELRLSNEESSGPPTPRGNSRRGKPVEDVDESSLSQVATVSSFVSRRRRVKRQLEASAEPSPVVKRRRTDKSSSVRLEKNEQFPGTDSQRITRSSSAKEQFIRADTITIAEELITEEALLIKSNRLMTVDEIPQEWVVAEEDDSADTPQPELDRSSRRARAIAGLRVDTDTLSEAAFARALRRLEEDGIDFETAVLFEKAKMDHRRSKSERPRQRQTRKHREDGVETDTSPKESDIEEAAQESKDSTRLRRHSHTRLRRALENEEDTVSTGTEVNIKPDGKGSRKLSVAKYSTSDDAIQLSKDSSISLRIDLSCTSEGSHFNSPKRRKKRVDNGALETEDNSRVTQLGVHTTHRPSASNKASSSLTRHTPKSSKPRRQIALLDEKSADGGESSDFSNGTVGGRKPDDRHKCSEVTFASINGSGSSRNRPYSK